MFELVFLGTAASVPSPERNQPGLLIIADGRRVLVDCGEGTQRQLLGSGMGLRRLDRLLLTHGHLDHVLGLPGLITTLGQYGLKRPMTINAGPHTLGFVAGVLEAFWGPGAAPLPLALVALEPGRVATEPGFSIDCFPVEHRDTDSFGFVFTGPDRRPLLPDRLAALGVPDGPERKRLADGLPITLADGREIDPEQVLGPVARGTRLAVLGDTQTTRGLAPHVRHSDALVIEATFLDRDAATARRYGHLTAAEAATLAAEASVGRLILTHISGRYTAAEILAEACRIFPCSTVAADFDRLTIR